jgi:hypothetical protein
VPTILYACIYAVNIVILIINLYTLLTANSLVKSRLCENYNAWAPSNVSQHPRTATIEEIKASSCPLCIIILDAICQFAPEMPTDDSSVTFCAESWGWVPLICVGELTLHFFVLEGEILNFQLP